MQILETEWRDILFRSRTEARHAVLMDTLGVEYRYEYQTMKLGKVRYLPDYYLPQQEAWLEIKGAYPTPAEIRKAKLLAYYTRERVFVAYGDIDKPRDFEPTRCLAVWRSRFFDRGSVDNTVIVDSNYAWCQCSACGAFGIAYFPYRSGLMCHPDAEGLYETPAIQRAIRAARRERFEQWRKGAA